MLVTQILNRECKIQKALNKECILGKAYRITKRMRVLAILQSKYVQFTLCQAYRLEDNNHIA